MTRKKPHKPHVFCIGWHKTGTSTMGMALLELGYSVLGCRLDMADPLIEGDIQTPLELAGQYDALQDVPWAALYKELDKIYPGSKFILTERDEESWMKSATKHFGEVYFKLHEWLYGRGVLKWNEAVYLDRYRKHNTEVKAYFAGRLDFLEMHLSEGDGWEKLCAFLEEPVPKKKFPYANKGKHNYSFKDKVIDHIRKAIPKRLRLVRVVMLEKIGLHKGRNRFNNMVENRAQRSVKKNK